MDFAWSKGCGGGAEVPRDKSPDGSPAEMPLRCGQNSLPRYLLRDAFKFGCVKESQSLSTGFLSGEVKNYFFDGGSMNLGLLFGSLDNAPVPSDNPVALLGFLSGEIQNLVTPTANSDDGSVNFGFSSGLLFNAVEIASPDPDASTVALGFQTGTLFDFVIVPPPVTEDGSESVGFGVGTLTTVVLSVSYSESGSYSVGFLSGSLV